ncbi:shikimate dehydrogenase [Syntrophus gentianae]|uniref:Shikimate dehydrogenase (NADP(+)) n=1 Tax=Syntrophus gentianae TaxID=43775 RepID=A0A1H7W230_9BACT|nr:shikimate dehydrogenase [Syntrophus gentianae]SEM15580.1 shikimate dehydrogenase [Syntrophus gentianae]
MTFSKESDSLNPIPSPTNFREPFRLALLGHPVGHSLSPLMHAAALKFLNLAGSYEAWDVSDLKEAVEKLRKEGYRGASVTIPFKREVMALLDDLDDQARAIGAVNTLIRQGVRLMGTNTDWEGLFRALRRVTEIKGKQVVVLGAGGTARAALYGLISEGGNPVVVNRTEEQGRVLAAEFGCPFYPLTAIGELKGDVLINTTPVGMMPNTDASPVPAQVLHHFRLVADVIYNPLQTRLLREAEQAGCAVLSGVEMFVEQGAAQFRLWTAMEAPVDRMRQVVREELERREKER